MSAPAEPTPAEAPRPRRWRRRLALVAALLVLLPAAALVGLLATDPGLAVVRWGAERAANDALLGEVRIGALTGSAFSTLVLTDLEVRDTAGREALRLDALRLSWRPAELLAGRVHVTALALERPVVRLVRSSSGALNLAELVPPSPPGPEAPPAPLALPRLELDALTLRDGALSFQDGDAAPLSASELQLDLGGTAGGERVQANLRHLSARLLGRHDLRAAAEAQLDGPLARLSQARVDLDDVALRVPELQATLPPGQVEGVVRLRVPPGAAARLGAPEALVGGLELAVRARRAADTPRWTLTATGALAGAPLTLSATATEDASDVQANLRLRDLRPAEVHRSAPLGLVDLELDARADLARPLHPEAQADLRLSGALQPPGGAPVPLSPVSAQVRLQGDAAEVDLEGRLGPARVALSARLAALFGAPVLEAARVDLRVPELGVLAGARAAGALTLTATASGPLDRISAEGRLEGARLAFEGPTRISALEADWDLEGLPGAPVGHVAAHLGPSVVAGRPLGGAELVVRARPSEDGVTVELQDLLLRTGGLVWRGDGARIELPADGAVRVQGLGLRSPAGALQVDAEVAPRGDLSARVRLEGVDLGALPREVVPELGALVGELDLQGALQKQGHRLTLDAAATARRLAAAPERPRLDLALLVALDPRAVSLTATVAGPELGQITVRAAGRPPRRMDSGAAWAAQLTAGLLETADVQLTDLSLGGLQAAAGLPASASGALGGAVTLRGPRTRATLLGANLQVAGAAGAPQARLRIELGHDPGRAFAHVRLNGAPLGHGTVSATVTAPRHLLDAPGWAGLDQRAVRGVRVDVRRLDLSVFARLGLTPDLEGLASARLEAGDLLHTVDAEVALEDVALPWVDGRWRAAGLAHLTPTPELSDTPDAGDLTVSVDVHRDALPVAHVSARAPLPLERILKAPLTAQDLPLEVDARVDALPLPVLAQAAGLAPQAVQGTLTASVSVRGPARDPRGTAEVRLHALTLGETRFRRGQLTVSLRERRVTARADLMDRSGGAVELLAEAGPWAGDAGGPGPVKASLHASGLELGALSRMGLLPVGLDGRLFGDLTAEGPPAALWPLGWAEVRDLRLVFSQAALQPLRGGLARVELTPRAAKVDVRGESAGGKLQATADAQVPLEGPTTFTSQLRLDEYPLAAGGALVRVDLSVQADGRSTPEGTEVNVGLDEGFIRVPDEKVEDLHPIEALEDVVYVDSLPGGTGGRGTRTATRAAGPPAVVHVKTLSPIDVRGGPVDATFVTQVDARAAGGKTALTGRAMTTDGALTLFRRRYVIERAQLIFDGQDPPDPRVSVRLRHDFSTLTFMVLVEGTASQPEVSFDSSPSRYSQGELLSIFLGTDPEDLGKKDDRSVSQQAVGAVAGLVVGRLQEQLGEALPIDTLDVELGDTTTGAGTRVTLGKWITRKLFLAYRYKFQADTQVENDNEAVVQYRFLPGWMVEVILGLVRNDAELVWMKRF